MKLIDLILYGPPVDMKRLDREAQARPIHQGFSVLAAHLSQRHGGE